MGDGDAFFISGLGLQHLYINSKLRFLVGGLATMVADNVWTSSVLPVNTWTHVAITYSLSDGEIRHYINGEVDATHNFTGCRNWASIRRYVWAYKAT